MGSISRLARVSHHSSSSSPNNYDIYVPISAKDPATGSATATATVLECYTPSSNSWRRVTIIPDQPDGLLLKDFSMHSIGRYIFVIGGRLCCKQNTTSDDSTGHNLGRVVPSVHRYDTRTNTWSARAPMTHPRFSFACTVDYAGKIFVAGGQSSLREATGVSFAEVYEPDRDQWRALPDMNTSRYKCVGVAWQGKIHVVGGFVAGPFAGMKRSSAEIYDGERNRWDFMARMWALDVPPYQILAVNGRLFSSGDCFMAWKGHIEMYDEKENIWSMVHGSGCDCLSPTSTADIGRQRVFLTMAAIGSQLYFVAGYRMGGGGVRSKVYVFETAAENGVGWRDFEAVDEGGVEKELCAHCCAVKREP